LEGVMEYSESLIDGGVTYRHKCQCCGNEKHHVMGSIKYAYLFLESLPIYPTGRHIILECSECLHITLPDDVDKTLYRHLSSSIFTVYHFAIKFLGLFLLLFVMLNWWQSQQEQTRVVQNIVSYPQINDFMLLDYRKLSGNTRPHEKFRIAKVIDITGETVSLAYGNFYYRHQSSFREAIASGQTRAFSYFGKSSHNFKVSELEDLFSQGGIVKAARPQGNMLFGNFIIHDTGYKVGSTYIPGERQYASGLAFEQATYLQEYEVKALAKFEESAYLGFALAQIKLAELYLEGDVLETNLNKALYWLELAALQSYEKAIKKYAIVCNQTKSCDLNAFYQRILDAGVNLTVNKRTSSNIGHN